MLCELQLKARTFVRKYRENSIIVSIIVGVGTILVDVLWFWSLFVLVTRFFTKNAVKRNNSFMQNSERPHGRDLRNENYANGSSSSARNQLQLRISRKFQRACGSGSSKTVTVAFA
uniref:Uncharacterized protein n=1 Tax=Glossina brevipalpis TaxID=37001 RepID=A0A1A9W2S7_9MUSC